MRIHIFFQIFYKSRGATVTLGQVGGVEEAKFKTVVLGVN